MIGKIIEPFIKVVKKIVEDPDHSFGYQPPELLFNEMLTTLQRLGQDMDTESEQVPKRCIRIATLALVLWISYTREVK